jgi:hypothetical protein
MPQLHIVATQPGLTIRPVLDRRGYGVSAPRAPAGQLVSRGCCLARERRDENHPYRGRHRGVPRDHPER